MSLPSQNCIESTSHRLNCGKVKPLFSSMGGKPDSEFFTIDTYALAFESDEKLDEWRERLKEIKQREAEKEALKKAKEGRKQAEKEEDD